MVDAAAVSLALPPMMSDGGFSPNEIAFLVGLHDVGKANPQFQHKVAGLSPGIARAGFPKTADVVGRPRVWG
jgi:hypothetical protein